MGNNEQVSDGLPWPMISVTMLLEKQLKFFPICWTGHDAKRALKGIILGMGSANGRLRYIVTSSFIGWAHIQNDPWIQTKQ